MTETHTLRITPAVADDLASRGVEDFGAFTTAGTYTVPSSVASELLEDALFYGNDEGPGAALTFGQRQAYAALARQLRTLGVEVPTEVTLEQLEARPHVPLEAPTPQPLGSFAPGTWVVHPVLGSMMVADVERVPATRRHGELVALRSSPAGDLGWREADELVTTR